MKQNLKDDILGRKSPGLFALVAVLALGISAVTYDEVHQKLTEGERDLAMVDRLDEVARLHVLITQISGGRLDDARQQLKAKLADKLATVSPLVASASKDAGVYARSVLAEMDRYEKAHPDYYLAASTAAGLDKIKTAPLDRQVAASKLASQ